VADISCPKCRAVTPPGAAFCPACGAPIGAGEARIAETRVAEFAQVSRLRSFPMIVGLSLVVGIAVTAAVLLFVQSGDEERHATPSETGAGDPLGPATAPGAETGAGTGIRYGPNTAPGDVDPCALIAPSSWDHLAEVAGAAVAPPSQSANNEGERVCKVTLEGSPTDSISVGIMNGPFASIDEFIEHIRSTWNAYGPTGLPGQWEAGRQQCYSGGCVAWALKHGNAVYVFVHGSYIPEPADAAEVFLREAMQHFD
jgi:hypothetical protein